MNRGTEATLHVAGTLASVGSSIGLGMQIASAKARGRREQAVDSVSELAIRLQEARQAQRAALHRAAQAEARLAASQAELMALRHALAQERQLTAALRDVCGI
ncbi:hypothetical protein [Methylobacterium pseudosasicola]|uniref:Uncharacterized protein n=1 Tax=Methylobacterium pseudosasicola TaxID=582667 RepID=A0A1I4NL31_9HYPH|nr:hypothetical protein [Methylobacterium pseudosasicola]SFM16075.1 hypothetical protein SAMN05192568_102141 [Methylobacterium pseudosasicola]